MNHLQNLSFSLHGADPSLCLVWIFVGLDFCPFQVEYSPSPFGKSSWSYFELFTFSSILLHPFAYVLWEHLFHFSIVDKSPTMCTTPESTIMHHAVRVVSLSKTSQNTQLSDKFTLPNRLRMMQQCSAGVTGVVKDVARS